MDLPIKTEKAAEEKSAAQSVFYDSRFRPKSGKATSRKQYE